MTKKKTRSDQTTDLRRQAEEMARAKATQAPEDLETLSPEATRQLLHELRVHQIELESQNEEMCRTQGELEASRARYFDLYDLAPVGYFTVSEQGLIIEANLTAAGLLSGARGVRVKQPLTRFILPEDQDLYYRHREQLFETGAPQVSEMRMLRADAAPFWARLEATTAQDGENGAPVCRTVVSDITDRKRAEEDLEESVEHLRRAIHTTIQVLVLAVETKDPYTAGHQKRTTNLARAMAAEMNLPPEKIEGLRMAGVIHDIGKISIPSEILSKPTKLPAMEYSLIKEHARHGYEILKDVESPWPLADIVYQHHERINGSGYPRGLKGEEILVEARTLAVADVVEAMASHRPYRPALGMGAALEEIEKNRGTLYDPAAVETCLRLIREKCFQLDVDAYR